MCAEDGGKRLTGSAASVLAALLALALAVSCAGWERGSARPPVRGGARVVLYVECPAKPSDPLFFRLSGLTFLRRDGGEVEVPVDRVVDAGQCALRQLRLAVADLPAGRYSGIRMRLAEARVLRGGQALSLALPGQEGEFVQQVDMEVPAQGAVAWFAEWRADESVVDNYLFSPRLDVRAQGMEMRGVLLMVTSAASGTVSVVDRQSGRVSGVVGVGMEPRGIAASPSADRVFVANAGSRSISVIHTATCRVAYSIPCAGAAPWELAVSDDGRWLVATNPEDDGVTVVDLGTDTVRGRIHVGRRPVDVVFDPSRGWFYVANRDSNSVSVVDPQRTEPVRTVPVGLRPRGLAVHDGILYVADSGAASLSRVAIPSYAVQDDVQVAPGPMHLLEGLAGRVYMTSRSSDAVHFVYAPMGMVMGSVALGGKPGRMAIDARRRQLYVVDSGRGELAVVDLASMTAGTALEVGDEPHGVLVLER